MNLKNWFGGQWNVPGQSSTGSGLQSTASGVPPAGQTLTANSCTGPLNGCTCLNCIMSQQYNNIRYKGYNITNQTYTPSYSPPTEPPWAANMRQALKDAMQNGGNDAITYVSMLSDTHKWFKLAQARNMFSDSRFPGIEEMMRRMSGVLAVQCDCHHDWFPTEEEVRELIARFRLLYC